MKNSVMRRILMVLMVVMLVSVCTAACAAAGTSVSISGSVSYSKGYSTVSWTTTGSEPSLYRVFAQVVNHGTSEQAVLNLGETKSHSIQAANLVPGISYSIIVTDDSFNILGTGTCTVPDVPSFEDGKLKHTSIKISLSKRQYNLSTRKTKDLKKLSGSEIAASFASNQFYYGVQYTMRMPQLAKPRAYFGTLVFESPDGFIWVDKAMDMTFDRVSNGYQTLWWEIAGVEFFYQLNEAVGSIPAGTYTIRLYWDGMFVNTITFDVGA